MDIELRLRLAQTIRITDGNNDLPPHDLGWMLADSAVFTDRRISHATVAELVERINPDKTLGAAALADAIADELKLD